MPTKALILDDCPRFIDELKRSLKVKGYQLFTCSNSSQAIETAFLEKPDIFICDWQLQKDISGIVVTEIIKCICDNVKVLFISGFNSFDLRQHLKNFNNLYFLEKPFSKKQLLDKIETIEQMKLVSDDHITPVAILELDKNKLTAFNKFAKRLEFQKIDLDKIDNSHWQKLNLGTISYLCRIREISSKKFILMLDLRNEMLVKDPRYAFFLNNTLDDSNTSTNCMLVIDEHEGIRSLASEIMLENKIFCHTAISVEEGINILDKDRTIRTVVVDSNFNENIINKLIKTVRKTNQKIRIVGACASSSAQTEGYKFDEVLRKPFNAQDLIHLSHKEKSHEH